eukprot:scaffold90296_cov68-Phaeocystis_antarctica.AAC.15
MAQPCLGCFRVKDSSARSVGGWGALLDRGWLARASHQVEGEHLECRGGRLLQRRAAALQEPHQRLHPARLRNLRGGRRVEGPATALAKVTGVTVSDDQGTPQARAAGFFQVFRGQEASFMRKIGLALRKPSRQNPAIIV